MAGIDDLITALTGKLGAGDMADLIGKLNALQQIKTQEDFDEGARLHAEKNAPWVNGMYSHLKFPAYEYREYPKAMYRHDYGQAVRELGAAQALLVSGTDLSRDLAIKDAQRKVDDCVCVVQTPEQERLQRGQGWGATPAEAEQIRQMREAEEATQAAHLAYEDRRLTGPALAERELADELAEGHLVDVTGTLAKARGRKPRGTVAVGV